MLILRPPWTSQPQGPADVDWGNPLAAGIVAGASYATPTRELVSGAAPTLSRGIAPGAGGLALSGTAGLASYASSDLINTACGTTQPRTVLIYLATTTTGNTVIMEKGSNESFVCQTDGGKFSWRAASLSTFKVDSTTNVNTGLPVVVAGRFADRRGTVFVDGRNEGQSTNYDATAANTSPLVVGARTGNVAPMPGQVYCWFIWNRALSDEEIAQVSANPWQLFAPRTIWVPVAASGPDVTQALSGASATSQAGTLAPTITAALSGTAASFAAGTVAPSQAVVQALTGVSTTAQTGTLPASITAALSGASATWQAGNVASGSDVVAALSGVSAVFAQGTEAVSTTVALSGIASTFAAGTVAPAQAGTAQLSGQATAVQAGTLAPSITAALSGVSSTFAAGTVAPTQAAVQALTGQAATYATGTLAPTITVAFSGSGISSAAGTVSPTQANIQALSGVSATLATGTLAPTSSATVALSGLGVAVSPGVVGLPQSATVALVGQSLSAVLGNLYIIGAWTPVNDAAGNTWAPVNDTSSNGWTPITWG